MDNAKRDSTSRSGANTGRRGLLRRGLQWLAAATGAAFLFPLLRFTGHRVPPKPRLVEVPAPLPASGVHTAHDFLLFAAPDGTGDAVAVSRICTHLGCRINYQEERQVIECPCHQSRFTPKGRRIAGPAEKDLPAYPVTVKKNAEDRVVAYVVQL